MVKWHSATLDEVVVQFGHQWSELLNHGGPTFGSIVWLTSYCDYLLEGKPRFFVAEVDTEFAGVLLLQEGDGGALKALFGPRTDIGPLIVTKPAAYEEVSTAAAIFLGSVTGSLTFECVHSDEAFIALPGAEISRALPCPVLDVPGWRQRASRRLVAEARHDARSLARLRGPVAQTWRALDDEGIEELMAMSRRWRGERGQPSLSNSRREQRFFRAVLPLLAEHGACRLSELSADGIPVSFLLTISMDDGVGLFSASHDVQTAKFSPGTVHLVTLLDELSEQGVARFDFLRGDEAYKYRFGATDAYASLAGQASFS